MSLNYKLIAKPSCDILYKQETVACYVRRYFPGELKCATEGLSQDIASSRLLESWTAFSYTASSCSPTVALFTLCENIALNKPALLNVLII
jgi:hypothetical protein